MITDLKEEDSLMIGKIKKGRSFGGCIRYVTQKDDAEIIASEGVLLGTAEEMARSFRWQCLLNPDVAKPVGHIALSFKPEDAPRLTDAFNLPGRVSCHQLPDGRHFGAGQIRRLRPVAG